MLLADVVDGRRQVPRSWLRAQAWQEFRKDLARRRPAGEAVELLRLALDPDWLDDQSTDRLTPPAEWDALGRAVFPGAAIAALDRAHALSWTAPDTGPDACTDLGRAAGSAPGHPGNNHSDVRADEQPRTSVGSSLQHRAMAHGSWALTPTGLTAAREPEPPFWPASSTRSTLTMLFRQTNAPAAQIALCTPTCSTSPAPLRALASSGGYGQGAHSRSIRSVLSSPTTLRT